MQSMFMSGLPKVGLRCGIGLPGVGPHIIPGPHKGLLFWPIGLDIIGGPHIPIGLMGGPHPIGDPAMFPHDPPIIVIGPQLMCLFDVGCCWGGVSSNGFEATMVSP